MLKQSLQQRLLQKLSPQQIQLMKMIQLPTQAFEQKLKQEIEENPALETGKENEVNEDDNYDDEFDSGNETIDTDINVDEYLSDDEIPSYRLNANNYSSDDEEKSIPYAAGKSFNQHLIEQLNTYSFTDKEYLIAEFLVGSIDESGYIRRPIEDIIDDLAFSQNIFTESKEVFDILNIIHQLDPAGVGARDLKECLILQLKRKKETKERLLAIKLLEVSFEQFVKKHYNKLILKHEVSEDELRDAIKEIEKLNPKPGGNYVGSSKTVEQIIPDFTLNIEEGVLNLFLNARNAPELHVSREYNNLLKGYQESTNKSKSQKEAVFFVKQKLDAAKWFIDAVKQRQQTLLLTMTAIMHYQEAYFLSGDERKLKPMILKDIAEKVHMDISTISRVANSKYVDTPYGTKLIKEFFSESMKNDQGDDVSTKEIKNILQTFIEKEIKSKPYTDDKLAALLKEKGYPIARRTIAKYREQLGLPVARLRKQF
ncbi:MAG: RNA polymerase factor sigma-54 [Flavobacteriales bacterium]|jgi:RNA polymerase sigma-54 factor|nr:RNA polymerase factor sigma-54 [Flavobacteriales bacterium]